MSDFCIIAASFAVINEFFAPQSLQLELATMWHIFTLVGIIQDLIFMGHEPFMEVIVSLLSPAWYFRFGISLLGP